MVDKSRSSDADGRTSQVVIGDVEGGIHGSTVIGRDLIKQIIYIMTGGTSELRHQRNRHTMLERVRARWVKGILESSGHSTKLIELEKQELAKVIDDPWTEVVETPIRPNRTLPPGQRIIDVLDEMGGTLLILGEPGSGKTTTLLELARDAIARAESDPQKPIPVVFSLSSWVTPKQKLASWLVEELNTKYYIPHKVGRQWMADNALLLLLDGLDEVKAENRNSCAEAINQFRQDYGFCNIVVCSRTEEYQALTTRIKLDGAILILPLTTEQIDGHLTATSAESNPLHTMLQQDTTLLELARSPLMLNIMTLAYQGRPSQETIASDMLDGQHRRLLDTYVERMLKRRSPDKRFTPEQTVQWLVWLARMMSEHGQTEFFIEGLQPTWLATHMLRLLHAVSVRLVSGLSFVLVCVLGCALIGKVTGIQTIGLAPGLVVGLALGLASVLASKLPVGLSVGLAAGLTIVPASWLLGDWKAGLAAALIFGLIGGLAGVSFADRKIKIAETLSWSWKKAVRGLAVGLAAGLTIGLVTGRAAELTASMLAIVLSVGLAFMLALGLSRSEKVETRTIPNQGIWRSAHNAIQVGLTSVLASVLFGIPIGVLDQSLPNGLTFGLFIGLPVGLTVALLVGGAACIQHAVLRLMLYLHGYPWNFALFLEYATERVLLRKVGGGFTFTHRLLLDYFAGLET